MVGRSAPTGRRIRIATELRKLRERAGLTATEAARVHGIGQGQLSNIETARFGVSGERLRTMAQNYECSDRAFIEALVDMVNDRKRGWWSDYQELLPTSLLDLAELEHHAERLRGAITAHIPGLLQSADHAREIFRQHVPEAPAVGHRAPRLLPDEAPGRAVRGRGRPRTKHSSTRPRSAPRSAVPRRRGRSCGTSST